MRGLLIALGFLSTIPVARRVLPKSGDIGRSVAWFPVVGLLIGLALAGVDWCGRALWGAQVAAALMIGSAILLTGGLHIDGLMDTADAFFSHRDREGMLAIMKDSRAGALGVAAAVALLLIKFSAFVHLADLQHWRIIAVTPVLGRLGIATAVALFPYARESGTGAQFAKETRVGHFAIALLFAVAISFGLLHLMGVGLTLIALILSYLGGIYGKRRLGGLTGDLYGAINEIIEVIILLVAGAYISR